MPTIDKLMKDLTLTTTTAIATAKANQKEIEELTQTLTELKKDYLQTKEQLRQLLTRINRAKPYWL